MQITITVPDRLATIAANRGLTPEAAAQQAFALGYGDWKSRGRHPQKEMAHRIKEKDLELQELRLKLRAESLATRASEQKRRDEKRALKAFREVIGPGMTVATSDGHKVVLRHPSESGTAWLGVFVEGELKDMEVMLPIKLMRPVTTE